MAVTRGMASVLLLLLLAPVGASGDAVLAEGALPEDVDDSCPSGSAGEECELSLRQLRAKRVDAEVGEHDHAMNAQQKEAWSLFGTTEKCCRCKSGTVGWSASGKCSFCTTGVAKTKSVDSSCVKTSKNFKGNTVCANGCKKSVGSLLETEQQAEALLQSEEVLQAEVEAAAEDEALAEQDTRGRAAAAASNYTGACTERDEAIMTQLGSGNGAGSFPKYIATCGRNAAGFFGFNQGNMASCIERTIRLSSNCANCFSAAGRYGYDHCKFECLFGSWCSGACLSCASEHDAATNQCAGVVTPKVEPC